MRLLAPLLAAVVLLLVPAGAGAKGVASAKLCGPSACRSVEDDATGDALIGGSSMVAAPPEPGPFYHLVFEIGGEGPRRTLDQVYLPSAGALRTVGEADDPVWMRVTPRAQSELDVLATGLAPYPAARLGDVGAAPLPRPLVAQPAADDRGLPVWPFFVAGGVALLGVGLVAARRARPA
jgi:hypothetical protein